MKKRNVMPAGIGTDSASRLRQPYGSRTCFDAT
jgi:hypothetical protein